MINTSARKIIFSLAGIFICSAGAFLPCLTQISSGQQDVQAQADQQRLSAILRKSRDYCRRLEKAALDFVCLEEVIERFDRTKDFIQNLPSVGRDGRLRTEIIQTTQKKRESNKYLYDYQFIRKNQQIKEKRNLLEVNGKKKNIKDSSLHTTMFQYENVLFGPVGLLSESWQRYYDFKLIGEDSINGEQAVVIDATPRPSLYGAHCYGKIWVIEDDGSVIKIVWDQQSIGNFKSVEEWAKKQKSEPQITSISEYGFEKNGLRFPSRDYTEEAYIKEDKKKFVRAETTVVYKDYKFFVVETEINIRR